MLGIVRATGVVMLMLYVFYDSFLPASHSGLAAVYERLVQRHNEEKRAGIHAAVQRQYTGSGISA